VVDSSIHVRFYRCSSPNANVEPSLFQLEDQDGLDVLVAKRMLTQTVITFRIFLRSPWLTELPQGRSGQIRFGGRVAPVPRLGTRKHVSPLGFQVNVTA